jgi:hypothetical protein
MTSVSWEFDKCVLRVWQGLAWEYAKCCLRVWLVCPESMTSVAWVRQVCPENVTSVSWECDKCVLRMWQVCAVLRVWQGLTWPSHIELASCQEAALQARQKLTWAADLRAPRVLGGTWCRVAPASKILLGFELAYEYFFFEWISLRYSYLRIWKLVFLVWNLLLTW